MTEQAPLGRVLQATIPAPSAANAAQDQVVGEAPFAGIVTEVTIISEGAVVAHGTNYRTIRLLNKGAAGAGTTVVASLALDTPTTDDLAAFDEKTIPLSGTAANLVVAEGDVLAVDETVAAAGLAHVGYEIAVSIARS